MLNIDKYLTVRWQMGGRAFPVLDCYGIVHEVRRDLGLPEWPAFEAVIKERGSPEMGELCESFSRDLTLQAMQRSSSSLLYGKNDRPFGRCRRNGGIALRD